jgi:hypothetical protein
MGNSPAMPAVTRATSSVVAPSNGPSGKLPGKSGAPAAAILSLPAPRDESNESNFHTNAASGSNQNAVAKNPEVLFYPMHMGNTSLMFKKSDMDIITGALEIYDKLRGQKSTDSTDKDDLSSLIDSLKSHDVTARNEPPPPLPNLYLGSIVYYSPSQWSVWINGKKLVDKNNSPANEFYITDLTRTAIELIWHPKSLQQAPTLWEQLTGNGAHPLPDITVNEKKGTITLHLHANQTFLPRRLAIREGLVKSAPVASTPDSTLTPNTPPPTAAQQIMEHPFSKITQ